MTPHLCSKSHLEIQLGIKLRHLGNFYFSPEMQTGLKLNVLLGQPLAFTNEKFIFDRNAFVRMKISWMVSFCVTSALGNHCCHFKYIHAELASATYLMQPWAKCAALCCCQLWMMHIETVLDHSGSQGILISLLFIFSD